MFDISQIIRYYLTLKLKFYEKPNFTSHFIFFNDKFIFTV